MAGETVKPKRVSFLVVRAGLPVGCLLLLGAGLIGAGWASPDAGGVAVGLGVALLLMAGLLFLDAWVGYGKACYVFEPHQIIHKGGGIGRDVQTELNVGQITHVKLILPWPRYPLFGVGDVIIDSAGSGGAMRCMALRDPEAVLEKVRALMRANGFSLTCTRRLHEEQPPVAAIVRELAIGAGAVLGLAVLGGSLLVGMISLLPEGWRGVAAAGFLLLAGAIIITVLALRCLDLKRRTYTVFEDAVVYTEGFLTRENAFLPAENLADAKAEQTLFTRLLGLHDVTISCQGSGQEVVFRGLGQGPALRRALDELAEARDRSGAHAGAPEGAAAGAGESGGDEKRPGAAERAGAAPGGGRKGVAGDSITLRMEPARALAGYAMVAGVLLVLMLLGSLVALASGMELGALIAGQLVLVVVLALSLLSSAVRGLLAVWFTTFEFAPHSLRRSYRFLQTSETEFGNEKLTGVVCKRNPLDRWMGNGTFRFWSIGASEALVFRHLPAFEGRVERAIAHGGMAPEPVVRTIRPRWCVRSAWGENLPLLVFAVLAGLGLAAAALAWHPGWWGGLPVLAGLLGLVLAWEPVHCRWVRLELYEGYLVLQKGVFFRERTFVRYENVKHLTTVRYPASGAGRVQLAVAGHGLETTLSMAYVDEVQAVGEALDAILLGGSATAAAPAPAGEAPAHLCRPAAANTLFPLVVWSMVLTPLVALLPFTLPWALITVRRRRYQVELTRVAARWGVIYARRRTVCHTKIDHIEQARGLLNKLFKNGNVQVYTAGSSEVDLEIRHIPDDRAFYEALHAAYARQGGAEAGGKPAASA